MILQRRPCPHCGTTTYQKFINCLRCPLTSRSYWQCLDCGGKISARTMEATPQTGRPGKQILKV
ncbi:hypothetical protein SAMN02745704_00346 [Paucidesulfovibrio gracilis DSM 16080]|uniref:Uncharacterized protein n=1 Tax=Paucidesulfovibrio gracilis DSM 16080 TaxID=1121449 RepID=A0A1T4W547_9BACT|nr:hypothetical protein [Paucidesulfovibrio gracilis]SKA72327.1 hypothetical protein SAMN02745704_00346 [Paucidesulfovibrio gracilis DSM 16080]